MSKLALHKIVAKIRYFGYINSIDMRKSIEIEYEEYSSIDELSTENREVLLQAMAAANGAYSPYSRFKVGAAVKLIDGKIVRGNNQENIAYPSGLCAERVAIFAAMAQNPNTGISSIAIVGKNKDGQWCPASPCGACRQVMGEYERLGKKKITLILYADNGKIIILKGVDSILPFQFSM